MIVKGDLVNINCDHFLSLCWLVAIFVSLSPFCARSQPSRKIEAQCTVQTSGPFLRGKRRAEGATPPSPPSFALTAFYLRAARKNKLRATRGVTSLFCYLAVGVVFLYFMPSFLGHMLHIALDKHFVIKFC
jgi:hypothetical protein